ncbi:RES family NAD+ phosphorylase [Pleurocapsa sp. PCC 7319]|uniref:RES family NAD+ phosphorylase n=1 Tax=Pleurocapsa sp. PCC 7319 TaxID=118161 RepID=UPI00034638D4|nr:RES family NAD+ phosphorylase [Pleurocapsa sp. PCC 7319]
MVEIRYPPPTRNISPQWFELKPGTTIQRIFDPTSYGATATGFRYYGPLSRFDHQKGKQPKIDNERGIIYAGFNLSCCLIEVFGDDEAIKIQKQQIAFITLKQSLRLLDLRDSGAWNAGSVVAMASDGRRKLTQAWSRYFYENSDLYGNIEGLIFNNAHDGKPAIALYERAASKLLSADVSVLDLNEPTIRETVLAIATKLNLLVEIEL